MGCTQSSAPYTSRQKKEPKTSQIKRQSGLDDTSDTESSGSLGGPDDSCYSCDGAFGVRKLFTKGQSLNDKLVSIIVTIFEGSSYDEMFREIAPITVPGERTSTYSLSCSDIGKLHMFLAATTSIPEDENDVWRCLIEDVRQVPSDSVVFNWECCSGCGNNPFPCSGGHRGLQGLRSQTSQPSVTMQFMGFALRSGFTVMCSDFSLKSLIHEWSEEQLGPNPFLQLGTCDRQFCLDFIPADLQSDEVPQQLQVVGELCADKSKAVVTALGGTILYSVNPVRQATDLYTLKVLTVVTDYASDCADDSKGAIQEEAKCTVGEGDAQKKGLAGHVTLTYAEGGQLVTSMGHWIELARLDASVESILKAARHNFGEEEFSKFRREYDNLGSVSERGEWLQKTSKDMVLKSTPSRMKQRTKY